MPSLLPSTCFESVTHFGLINRTFGLIIAINIFVPLELLRARLSIGRVFAHSLSSNILNLKIFILGAKLLKGPVG